MEKSSKIIQAILAVAIVVLFVLHFTSNSCSKTQDVVATSSDSSSIVFINTDSLLVHYEFAKVLNDELISREEKSRADFNETAKIFQQDLAEFQRKVQNNGFLSMERARDEEKRLGAKERELQALNSKLSNQLMMAQNSMNKQLRDSLTAYLNDVKAKVKFDIVLSNNMGDNILYGSPATNITDMVIKGMNARYANSIKK